MREITIDVNESCSIRIDQRTNMAVVHVLPGKEIQIKYNGELKTLKAVKTEKYNYCTRCFFKDSWCDNFACVTEERSDSARIYFEDVTK